MLTAIATALGASALCVVQFESGCRFELDARSRTEAGMLWNGEYEPDFVQLLIDLEAVYGGTIYDVGANVGLVAVPLARAIRTGGSIVCFEPAANNVERLRENIRLNDLGNCRVFAVALGAQEGSVQLARESRGGAATGNAVIVTGHSRSTGATTETVAVATLDGIVATEHLPLPDIIKLDVEGSEVGFLTGAKETLRRSRPVILGEFNSMLMPNFGTSFIDAARALPDGYAVFAFTRDGRLQEREPSVGLGDVLLVPREKIARLPRLIQRG